MSNYSYGGYNDLTMQQQAQRTSGYQNGYSQNSWNLPQQPQHQQQHQQQQQQQQQPQYRGYVQKSDAQHQQQAMQMKNVPVALGQQTPDAITPLNASNGIKNTGNVHHQGMNQREVNPSKPSYAPPSNYERASQAVPPHRNQPQGLSGRMDNSYGGYGHAALQFDGQNLSSESSLASKGNNVPQNKQQSMRAVGDFLGGPSVKNMSAFHTANQRADQQPVPYNSVSSMTQTSRNEAAMSIEHPGMNPHDLKDRLPPAPPAPPARCVVTEDSRRVASEVATAFVREFYRTLKFNPEKLRMFYSPKSQMSCQVCSPTEDNSGTEWKSYYGQTDDEISEIFGKIFPLSVPAELITDQSTDYPFVALSKVITLDSQPTSDGGIVLQASGTILDRYGSERSFTHSAVLTVDVGSRSYSIAHDMLIFGEPTIPEPLMAKLKAAKQTIAAPESVPVEHPVDTVPQSINPSTEDFSARSEVDAVDSGDTFTAAKQSDQGSCPSAAVTEATATVAQPCDTVAPKAGPWKTLNQNPPVSPGIRAEDEAAKASSTVRSSAVPTTAIQSVPQASLPSYGASTYAGKLIATAGSGAPEIVAAKVTTQVVRRSAQDNRQKNDSQGQVSEQELKLSKTLYVPRLIEFSDEDIMRAIGEALVGKAVEGRVVGIERMASGPSGFIELDSQACADLLLSRPNGFCLRGKNVKIERARTVYTPATRGRNDRRNRQVGDENSQPNSTRGGQRGGHRNNNDRHDYNNRADGDGNPNSYRNNRYQPNASRGGWTEKA